MPTKSKEMQYLIRQYRETTGNQDVEMHEVAKFAVSKGWPLPKPRTALDRLASQFSAAAREEMRKDEVTGHPYRANLAVTALVGGEQMTFWYDIETATRKVAHKSLTLRREQMVGDALQLTFDAMHWNRINPQDEPIEMPLDFADDVAWRMNAPDDKNEEAA